MHLHCCTVVKTCSTFGLEVKVHDSFTMSVDKKIGSFAILDLETAGLPDYNFNKTSITELCVHAFAADDILNATSSDPPRINQKLTLLFNPLMRIDPKAEEITGLNNYMLEGESPFNENAVTTFIGFLKHLRQPVCLVAHNGNRFDFPVLKYTLGNHGEELPTDLTCADSLEFFKHFDLHYAEEIPPSQEEDCLQGNDENQIPSTTDIREVEEEPFDRQKLLETTPKRRISNAHPEAVSRKQPKRGQDTTPARKPIHFRRALFTPSRENKPNKESPSYRLEAVYKRVFDGSFPDPAHHAEADVVALQKILLHHGKSFVDYAETNAKLFKDVKRLGAR